MLAHFSHHLVSALLTPLLPFIRDDFTLDYTRVGVLTGAYALSYGISQLPGGWLADRVSPRVLIAIGISGVALFGILVGLSTTFIMMTVFLVLMGLVGGGYHPAASPLVAASVESAYRGRALGIHQIGGTLSFFLAPLIAVGIAAALSWRGSFITLAIPTLVFGIVFYLLVGRRQLGKTDTGEASDSQASAPNLTGHYRRLIPFLILAIAIQVLIFSTLSFITLFVVDHFKASEEVAGALLALAHSAGLWAGPLGGYLSDRLGKVPVMLVMGAIAGPAIYLLNLGDLGWSISVILLILGMTQYLSMPVAEAYVIGHTSERNRSTVLGIYYSISRGGPGAVAPVMGYLIDRFSFNVAFTSVAALMTTIALTSSLFLWRNRDR